MTAVVIFLGIVLGIIIVCISVLEIRNDNLSIIPILLIICFSSVAFGMCFERVNTVSTSDYLKSPENYQVDTFIVNSVIDHYEISNK